MLEARFGLPDVTTLPQATAADDLLVRCLDTGTCSVLAAEFFSFLPLARRAQRLMMLCACKPMRRGSSFDLVQRARLGHGPQSFRANRASNTIPFCG